MSKKMTRDQLVNGISRALDTASEETVCRVFGMRPGNQEDRAEENASKRMDDHQPKAPALH